MEVHVDAEEDLLKRHRKENKDLQARIQNLKKSIPKGDKKKKKEVSEQIARLEAEQDDQHQMELQSQQNSAHDITVVNDAMGQLAVSNVAPTERASSQYPHHSRAQKRKEKKAQKEHERQERITLAEQENVFGVRNQESLQIAKILSKRNLLLHDIPSDGDCLYSAVKHQLGGGLSVSDLREKMSAYMLDHQDDFLPFITDPETGDILSADGYKKYCEDICNTPVWGGQIELRALSQILQRPIHILQADSPVIMIGDEYSEKAAITLVYHRHIYGLGEHYNSVKPRQENGNT